MGSLGIPELIVLFGLALLIFGPRKLPELGRTIGKALTEFRRASNELRYAVEDEMRELDRQTRETEAQVAEPSSAPLPQAAEGETIHAGAPTPPENLAAGSASSQPETSTDGHPKPV